MTGRRMNVRSHSAAMTRRPVLALAALLAATLVACGDDGDGAASPTTTTTVASTTTLTPTTTVAGTTTSAGRSTSTTAARGGADITVAVDGQNVALQRVCRGVDGAVVAIADTGRRIILVREEGLALRIGTEGATFAETDQVRTTQVGGATHYEGTILVEGQPTPVTMQIASESGLTPC